MITAVDTSVVLDVLAADPLFGPASREALRSASLNGQLIACEVVWAESLAHFASMTAGRSALETLHLEFSPIARPAAEAAASAWREYRRRGGKRTRVIADFLVGAHARHQADRLLTRDRGFHRTYFTRLTLLDPTGSGRPR